jgi:hypothetical protein
LRLAEKTPLPVPGDSRTVVSVVAGTSLPEASWSSTVMGPSEAPALAGPDTAELVNTTLLAAAVTPKDALVAGVRPVRDAVSVKVPVRLRDRPGKVATPLTAATDVGPFSEALAGPLPRATATVAVLATWLPKASWIATDGAGLIVRLTTVSLGCWTKASLLAAAGVTVWSWLAVPKLEAAVTRGVPALVSP